MHIIFNVARDKIRNVSLASGSVTGVCRLIGQTVLRCCLHSLLLVSPLSANSCQLAVSLSPVNPGYSCDHVQLKSRISKSA